MPKIMLLTTIVVYLHIVCLIMAQLSIDSI